MSLEPGAGVRVALLVLVAACQPPGYGRHVGVDAAAGSGDAAAAVDAAVDGAPARTCTHGFRLDGHATASSAALTGDFVQWAGDPAHGAVAMTLGADGGWTCSYTFMVGTYQYKFIVDGSWIPDPTNTDTVPDGFGGVNSVYTCN
jgi:hypothetical protein